MLQKNRNKSILLSKDVKNKENQNHKDLKEKEEAVTTHTSSIRKTYSFPTLRLK